MSWEEQFYEKSGEYIRAARERKGLKQREIANAVGITQSYYSNIESGKREMSYRLATKIFEVLDLSADAAIRFTKMRKPRVIRPEIPPELPTDLTESGNALGR